MKVCFNLSVRLILIMLFVLFMFSVRVIGDQEQVKIRWKNGDVLPGRILQSQNPVLHFSSEIFQDNLAISTSELEALEFDSEKGKSDLDFLIVTTTGDVIKANLVDANENSFIFSSKRLSRIQIKRNSVYSLSRLNNPNLIFDGSQFNQWDLASKKTINNLVSKNYVSWIKGEGGHPFSNTNKSVLSTSLEIPAQFNLDLEISSIDSPRFLFAIGDGSQSAESDGALKLETWDNEIVLVQGQIFEPVTTIKGAQKVVRFRLSYDSVTGKLQVLNANGSLLVEVEDVHLPVQAKTNVSIRNRGDNLSVKRMVFYKGANRANQEMIDAKKSRVLMADGKVYYGKLFVSNQKSFIRSNEMTRKDVDLSRVDRILNPNAQFSDSIYSSELIYNDDTVIRGELIQLNQNKIKLQTQFSEQPVNCLLAGASYLKFNSGESKAHANGESQIDLEIGSTLDKMAYPGGMHRGEIAFNSDGLPLAWNPDGSRSPLELTGVGEVSVERNSNGLSQFLSFDKGEYPHLLYLRHGEIIPSSVSYYGKDGVEFHMPFDKSVKKINTLWVKAIEFNPIRTLKSKTSKGTELVGQMVDWEYLANTELEVKEGLIGWTNIDYDQIKFKVGLPGIGYGERGVSTEVPKGTTAVFLRHSFDLKEELKSGSLYLLIDYDDGFAAYLNGRRIAEANAPLGNLDEYSMATGSHEAGEVEQFNISEYVNLLSTGKNVLAIAGLNNAKTSSDLLINPILSTEPLISKKTNNRKKREGDPELIKEKKESEANSVKLNRALMPQRYSRNSPPTHLLLSKNNDIGQGKLLTFNKKVVCFELASENFTVPVERLDKVVSVEDLGQVDSDILNYDFKSQTRLFLVDGSVFDLVVEKSDNEFLFGKSNIYGEVAIPVVSIQKINLGGFEGDVFESKYDEWIIRSVKEFNVE